MMIVSDSMKLFAPDLLRRMRDHVAAMASAADDAGGGGVGRSSFLRQVLPYLDPAPYTAAKTRPCADVLELQRRDACIFYTAHVRTRADLPWCASLDNWYGTRSTRHRTNGRYAASLLVLRCSTVHTSRQHIAHPSSSSQSQPLLPPTHYPLPSPTCIDH